MNNKSSKNSNNNLALLLIDDDIESDAYNDLCKICGYSKRKAAEYHDNLHMIMIIPNLYLGAKQNAHNMFELNTLNINLIVNVAYGLENKFSDFFEYISYPWNDVPDFNILNDLDTIVDKIHNAIKLNQNVLVHCYMGISRSVSVIIAYLMKYDNKNYDDAFNFVKSKKKLICPNDGFVLQLKSYFDRISKK
jgi:protein-tyrosine phosphatase